MALRLTTLTESSVSVLKSLIIHPIPSYMTTFKHGGNRLTSYVMVKFPKTSMMNGATITLLVIPLVILVKLPPADLMDMITFNLDK